ncbi:MULTISPECIES: YveK family protein [Gordonia]|uniref:YveK family protein n=1 Tax=Gordonia TaxID=2053 RepID=UPI0019C8755E|nr:MULTISPECIES: Wzz/FepE/Etk N-terminal domain-containing protein [Gordonia]MBD0024536.1 hypothetical protein [Gordonia sp. (in: high G+C Gram-positive bacteria)]
MNSLLEIYRRRILWVVLCALIAVAIPVAQAISSSDSYRATARLFVATAAQNVTDANQGALAGQSRVTTYAEMATGPELLLNAAEDVGGGVTAGDIASSLQVTSVPGSVLVDISARSSNRERAAAMAQAVADQLVHLVGRAEAPISGGTPSLGLMVIQPAASAIEKVPAYNWKVIGAWVVGGLILGSLLAILIPERSRRRGANDPATVQGAREVLPDMADDDLRPTQELRL